MRRGRRQSLPGPPEAAAAVAALGPPPGFAGARAQLALGHAAHAVSYGGLPRPHPKHAPRTLPHMDVHMPHAGAGGQISGADHGSALARGAIAPSQRMRRHSTGALFKPPPPRQAPAPTDHVLHGAGGVASAASGGSTGSSHRQRRLSAVIPPRAAETGQDLHQLHRTLSHPHARAADTAAIVVDFAEFTYSCAALSAGDVAPTLFVGAVQRALEHQLRHRVSVVEELVVDTPATHDTSVHEDGPSGHSGGQSPHLPATSNRSSAAVKFRAQHKFHDHGFRLLLAPRDMADATPATESRGGTAVAVDLTCELLRLAGAFGTAGVTHLVLVAGSSDYQPALTMALEQRPQLNVWVVARKSQAGNATYANWLRTTPRVHVLGLERLLEDAAGGRVVWAKLNESDYWHHTEGGRRDWLLHKVHECSVGQTLAVHVEFNEHLDNLKWVIDALHTITELERRTPPLSHLYVHHCPLVGTSATIPQMEEVLHLCPTLMEIHASHTALNKEGLHALVRAAVREGCGQPQADGSEPARPSLYINANNTPAASDFAAWFAHERPSTPGSEATGANLVAFLYSGTPRTPTGDRVRVAIAKSNEGVAAAHCVVRLRLTPHRRVSSTGVVAATGFALPQQHAPVARGAGAPHVFGEEE